MVETTKTAEALETATSGTGLMQSEYYKLKFNAETGQWEKEVVTEDFALENCTVFASYNIALDN